MRRGEAAAVAIRPGMEPLMTVHEVAAFLRKSVSWVYHAAAAGRLPGAVRIGNALRFNPDAIRAFARGEEGW